MRSTLPMRNALFCVLLLLPASSTFADELPVRQHAQTQRRAAKLESLTIMVDKLDGRPTSHLWPYLSDAHLRAGNYNEAIVLFEQMIEADPESEPRLWQYGIALFFAGRHADGQRLFEKHRVVNPHDVENAAWHFLCVAKASNVKEARKILLPAPDDRRAPMAQILERLPGGDFTAILDQIKDAGPDSSAYLYAHLYIGMIADAEGDPATAKKHIRLAAETPQTNYMADIARVYDEHLLKHGE